MNIQEIFLQLTSETYPHGYETELKKFLPKNIFTDIHGNYYITIGTSRTLFTCHLDTAGYVKTKVNHVFEDHFIKTDGTTILGADDKAGVAIMLNMIDKQIPGVYYFFLGEERGCIGSGKASKNKEYFNKETFDRVISFDRRGTNSVITNQSCSRCCSDDFGNALAVALNKAEDTFFYKIDPTGIYTDSAEFTSVIPECTNISVGYYSEHCNTEKQDIIHLTRLAEAVLKIDWENLPTIRDPKIKEYQSYYRGGLDEDYDWYYGDGYAPANRTGITQSRDILQDTDEPFKDGLIDSHFDWDDWENMPISKPAKLNQDEEFLRIENLLFNNFWNRHKYIQEAMKLFVVDRISEGHLQKVVHYLDLCIPTDDELAKEIQELISLKKM